MDRDPGGRGEALEGGRWGIILQPDYDVSHTIGTMSKFAGQKGITLGRPLFAERVQPSISAFADAAREASARGVKLLFVALPDDPSVRGPRPRFVDKSGTDLGGKIKTAIKRMEDDAEIACAVQCFQAHRLTAQKNDTPMKQMLMQAMVRLVSKGIGA